MRFTVGHVLCTALLTVDARSMAFLYSYSEASKLLAPPTDPEAPPTDPESRPSGPLAAIDCFDWTNVCGKHNISTYPTVRIYRRGQETVEYRGLLATHAVVATVKL